jgi:quercetin dioxygenase-like cupin family protein
MSEFTAMIRSAEVVLPSGDLNETVGFFIETLGFQLEAIFPADDPAVAVIAGHGVRLRLDRAVTAAPGSLRLACTDPDRVASGKRQLSAPNGTRIELVAAESPLLLPTLVPEFVLSRAGKPFNAGRAGMGYRDLIPGRQGGRFIASHICIAEAGPVPDYVHFHEVRFQMIYCRAGWAELVYEDQGPPFRLEAGDCVLQPPRIRHRVLASSAGLEVIEIGCPAVHETRSDAALTLPTGRCDPNRDFGGQRFHRHVGAEAPWQPWRAPGFQWRDTGIAAATGGLAGAGVIRPRDAASTGILSHQGELLFLFVLDGALTLDCAGRHALAAGDAATIPAGMPYGFGACTPGLRLLEVAMPPPSD